MRIAFYAPLKPPDHAVPSGDRRMARLLVRALEMIGHEVDVASQLRAYATDESEVAQSRIRDAAMREADALLRHFADDAGRHPALWFTYHVYYRAPDWIGPRVAEALSIPYVVAEASYASKRAGGVWDLGHRGVETALRTASLVFSLSERDTPALAKVPGFSARVVPLPPFIEIGVHPSVSRSEVRKTLCLPGVETPLLLAVGMMRARAKRESYRLLAEALSSLGDRPWVLAVAGDGPARAEIEGLFGRFAPGRLVWLGEQSVSALAALYRAADLFVWPGFDEAFGMVYLEAQAAALPVVAMDHGGVSSVVQDGVSGRLVAAGDVPGFSRAISGLLDDAASRTRLGLSARAFVEGQRSLRHAATRIDQALATAVAMPAGSTK